jgi:hypothetical protein
MTVERFHLGQKRLRKMSFIQFRKEKLSIHTIGYQRFWIGIAAGLIAAFLISLFFNHSREVLRLLTSLSTDLLILSKQELTFFNYFFSSLSTVLGLSITIWVWMQSRNHKRIKSRLYKQLSITYSVLWFWVVLMIVSRFGSLLPIVLLGTQGYDNHLNFLNEFWLIFVLIPVVIFLQSWMAVRLVYRLGYWMLVSFLFCIVFSLILQFTTTLNQEMHNNLYHQRFKSDYDYINQELSIASKEYGIHYDIQTIEILKKQMTESSIEQVSRVKKAFSLDYPVSLDTIILQKIIIRNYKTGNWTYLGRESIENWHYALPVDIMKQLSYFDMESNEAKALIEVIKEMIDLVNVTQTNWVELENTTIRERRRIIGAKYYIPASLIEQLKDVRAKLSVDERYSEIAKVLDEIKEN